MWSRVWQVMTAVADPDAVKWPTRTWYLTAPSSGKSRAIARSSQSRTWWLCVRKIQRTIN